MPCPKYEVFLEQLSGHGVSIETKIVDLDGKARTLVYLKRVVDGKPYYHSLRFAEEGEMVQLQVLRSVCRILRIDPAVFGLHLDKLDT